MDPLAFRLKNYAEVEPMTGKPFSSKALRQCYEQGADQIWLDQASDGTAADARRGGHAGRLGHGYGAIPRSDVPGSGPRGAAQSDGTGVVETGAHDMGQGAWTAFAQIAADSLGLELDKIDFRSGTSDLPDAGIAGGSAHTATVSAAIDQAGADVIGKLAESGDQR